jgi:hypothetical protein
VHNGSAVCPAFAGPVLPEATGIGDDSGGQPSGGRSLVPSSRLSMYGAEEWWYLPTKTLLSELKGFLAERVGNRTDVHLRPPFCGHRRVVGLLGRLSHAVHGKIR